MDVVWPQKQNSWTGQLTFVTSSFKNQSMQRTFPTGNTGAIRMGKIIRVVTGHRTIQSFPKRA